MPVIIRWRVDRINAKISRIKRYLWLHSVINGLHYRQLVYCPTSNAGSAFPLKSTLPSGSLSARNALHQIIIEAFITRTTNRDETDRQCNAICQWDGHLIILSDANL